MTEARTSPPSLARVVSVPLYQGSPCWGGLTAGAGVDRERRRRLRIGDLPALVRPTDLRGADLRDRQSRRVGRRTRRHEQGEHGGAAASSQRVVGIPTY